MSRLVVLIFVSLVCVCGCEASRQASSPPTATTGASSDPAAVPTSSVMTGAPTSSGTTDAPVRSTTSPAATTTPAATTNAPTSRVRDACDLLPASAVAAAVDAETARAAPSSQAQFTSCAYTVTASGGTGTVALDVATSRASQIFAAALASGDYSRVTGVGSVAAYNDDGHLIAHDSEAFVSITLPVDLAGTTLDKPATARTAAAALARQVLSAAG